MKTENEKPINGSAGSLTGFLLSVVGSALALRPDPFKFFGVVAVEGSRFEIGRIVACDAHSLHINLPVSP
jgi:hypothetical protein